MLQKRYFDFFFEKLEECLKNVMYETFKAASKHRREIFFKKLSIFSVFSNSGGCRSVERVCVIASLHIFLSFIFSS